MLTSMRGREAQRHPLGGSAMGAKDARLPCDDIGAARQRLDDGDALLADELQQRLVRIEAVEHAQVRLVGIAQLILVLVRFLEVEGPGQPDDGMRVDQARRHHRRRDDRHAFGES